MLKVKILEKYCNLFIVGCRNFNNKFNINSYLLNYWTLVNHILRKLWVIKTRNDLFMMMGGKDIQTCGMNSHTISLSY